MRPCRLCLRLAESSHGYGRFQCFCQVGQSSCHLGFRRSFLAALLFVFGFVVKAKPKPAFKGLPGNSTRTMEVAHCCGRPRPVWLLFTFCFWCSCRSRSLCCPLHRFEWIWHPIGLANRHLIINSSDFCLRPSYCQVWPHHNPK